MEHYLILLEDIHAQRLRLRHEIEDLSAARAMVVAYPEHEGPQHTLDLLCGKGSYNAALCRLMQMDLRYLAQETRLVQLIEKAEKRRETDAETAAMPCGKCVAGPAGAHATAQEHHEAAQPVDAPPAPHASQESAADDAHGDDAERKRQSNDGDIPVDVYEINDRSALAGPRIRHWHHPYDAVRGDP